VRRGEIRLYRFRSPDRRRPVLVLTRSEVVPLLTTVMVAPITTAVRGAPSEVVVGVDVGLKTRSAINLDHVQTVEQNRLGRYVGSVSAQTMARVCEALAIATGCDA
jgi:mRNA interferase MazF